METEPAPSGAGRLLHRASSADRSLFLGVTGDSLLGHPSTFSRGTTKKVWLLSEVGNYYFILIDNTCVTTKTNVRGVTCRRTAEHLPNTAEDYFKS